MRFSKAIKRIIALGTGATMMGATMLSAMAAADLSNYPSPFIKDGKFNGVLVIGDKAAAEDVIGVSDIAVSLQYSATKAAGTISTETSVEGDAWRVGTSTKILEISERLSTGTNTEALSNITTFIDKGDLKALASGTASNVKGDAPYDQYLYLLGAATGVSTGYVTLTEDDRDVTADFLYFKSGQQIARYVLEFTTQLESDVDDSGGTATSTGTYLTDFEDVEITILGVTYTIVQARRTDSTGGNIKLILMGGAVKDTLLEGETKTYNIKGKDYETTLDFVDADEAKFTINGESSRKLKDGDTDKLSDNTEVGVSEILYQDYAGGIHSATFYLGAQKIELKDTNVADGVGYSNSPKVGDNTIDDAYVAIEATNASTSYKLSRIHINMTADDDFYVPAGAKLSENPDLEEPEILFTNNWDIEYHGLKEVETEQVKIKTSGSSAYKLEFIDGSGNKVELPIAKSPSGALVMLGENDKPFINIEDENNSITKNAYFVVTDGSEKRGERKSYVLKYSGADKITADSPILKFKDLGSGDTIEQSYTNSSPLATLKIGGADYRVYSADDQRDGIGMDSLASNDFNIKVDMDASGALNAASNTTILITTNYGMEINITNLTRDVSANRIQMTFTIPDNDRPSSGADKTETLLATPFGLTISAAAGEVTFTQNTTSTYISLLNPDKEENVNYGYDSYGSYYKHETPTNDPATLTITVPKKQREALVYITAKGATITSASAATGEAVTINRIEVGATKLSSEVLDADANMNKNNYILVGGPCANEAARIAMGSPSDCLKVGIEPGEALIKLYERDGNVAMLVAGYAKEDTRAAAKVIAKSDDYKEKLKGTAVKLTTGTMALTEFTEPAATVEETTTTG